MEEAREIVGLFRSLRRHLVRESRAELARSGLTAGQLSVVSLLGGRESMTLNELGHELELSHSTVSGIVDRLEAKGVVQRRPHPDDRRYVLISLVDKVKRQGTVTVPDQTVNSLEAALADATAHERQTIKEGLALFRRHVERTAGEPPDPR